MPAWTCRAMPLPSTTKWTRWWKRWKRPSPPAQPGCHWPASWPKKWNTICRKKNTVSSRWRASYSPKRRKPRWPPATKQTTLRPRARRPELRQPPPAPSSSLLRLHHAVAATGLGRIQRCIRALDECVAVFLVVPGGYAKAGAYMAHRIERHPGNTRAHRLGHGHGGVNRRFFEQDDEFLTPEPRRAVGRTQQLAHAQRRALEHHIPRVVPKGIVDALEEVDVEHHNRQTALLDAGLGHLGLQPFKETPPIDQIGQKILGSQVFELAVEPCHGLDHQGRQRQIEYDKQRRKAAHQRRHHRIEGLTRLLQREVHRHLHHLDAHGFVHAPAETVLLAVHLEHGGRRHLRRAVARQALGLPDGDGTGHIQGAVHALAHLAGHLLLEVSPAFAEVADDAFFPLIGAVAQVGRVEHRLLVLVARKPVLQAPQRLGRSIGGHRLWQKLLGQRHVQVRLDKFGGVVPNRHGRVHHDLRVVLHLLDRRLLQEAVYIKPRTDRCREDNGRQHQIEFEPQRHESPSDGRGLRGSG